MYLAVVVDGYPYLDVKRVDLRNGHERRLLIDIFPGPNRHVGDDTIDWAADRPAVEPGLRLCHVDLSHPVLELRLGESMLRQVLLGHCFVARLGRSNLPAIQRSRAFGLTAAIGEPSPLGFDVRFVAGL